MSSPKKAIEHFFNSPVRKVRPNLFLWHDSFYEIYIYDQIPKGRSKDSFVKFPFNDETYGIRALSYALIKKWYSKLKLGVD